MFDKLLLVTILVGVSRAQIINDLLPTGLLSPAETLRFPHALLAGRGYRQWPFALPSFRLSSQFRQPFPAAFYRPYRTPLSLLLGAGGRLPFAAVSLPLPVQLPEAKPLPLALAELQNRLPTQFVLPGANCGNRANCLANSVCMQGVCGCPVGYTPGRFACAKPFVQQQFLTPELIPEHLLPAAAGATPFAPYAQNLFGLPSFPFVNPFDPLAAPPPPPSSLPPPPPPPPPTPTSEAVVFPGPEFQHLRTPPHLAVPAGAATLPQQLAAFRPWDIPYEQLVNDAALTGVIFVQLPPTQAELAAEWQLAGPAAAAAAAAPFHQTPHAAMMQHQFLAPSPLPIPASPMAAPFPPPPAPHMPPPHQPELMMARPGLEAVEHQQQQQKFFEFNNHLVQLQQQQEQMRQHPQPFGPPPQPHQFIPQQFLPRTHDATSSASAPPPPNPLHCDPGRPCIIGASCSGNACFCPSGYEPYGANCILRRKEETSNNNSNNNNNNNDHHEQHHPPSANNKST